MASRIDLHDIRTKKDERADQNSPVRGVVNSVQPETESVKIESFGSTGATTVAVRHPFMGKNAWIRAMPETGTAVITQKIREPHQVETWGYVSHRLGGQVKKAKQDNNFIFRELRQGEIEIMSAGKAYQHWSEDGNITMNGGVIEQHLTQTDLDDATQARREAEADRHPLPPGGPPEAGRRFGHGRRAGVPVRGSPPRPPRSRAGRRWPCRPAPRPGGGLP